MIPEAREVHLSKKDRRVLEARCRSPVSAFGGIATPTMVLKVCETAAAWQAADLYDGYRQADLEAAG
jgi:hypothetical protein